MLRTWRLLSVVVAIALIALGGAGTAQAGPDVPPVGDAARAAGFIDVRTVVPDAIIDLRYATTNNFTHTQQYPSDARCLVHQSMGQGLAAAATKARVAASGSVTRIRPLSPLADSNHVKFAAMSPST